MYRRRIWAASAAMLLFTLLYRASLLLIVPLWKHMPLPFFRPYDQVGTCNRFQHLYQVLTFGCVLPLQIFT